MPVFATLTTTSVRTTTAPMITTRLQAVISGRDGRKGLVPFTPATERLLGLSTFAGGSQRSQDVPGKTQSYRLSNQTDARLLLTMTRKTRTGIIGRTMLFQCSAQQEQGTVRMRYGNSLVTLLAAPLRRMMEDEAMSLLGGLYNPEKEYKDADTPRFGILLSGMTQSVSPQTIRTVGEHGEDKTVFVKRAPRRFG